MNPIPVEPVIVIATALPVESAAVVQYVQHPSTDVGEHGSRYKLGTFKNARVVLVETGVGNVDAAIEVSTAISRYKPRYLFFVGVAGGIKDVKIGDVVAADRIYNYQSGKADVSFLPRPKMGEASHFLVQLARAVIHSGAWLKGANRDLAMAQGWVGPIVSGDRVVSSADAPDVKLIRSTFSDALALDMEGFGVLRVGYSREAVRMIVIRGISDLLKNKGAADASGSQPRASSNAAAFTFQMIGNMLEETRSVAESSWVCLENLLVERYPLGPTQNEIWDRAGGDLSRLNLSQNGKANWHSAINQLRLGGGGKELTFVSLLACAMDDHPNAPELAELIRSLI